VKAIALNAAATIQLIRTAAAELPQINLDDALRICVVIREREPESFDRAACRWLARYCHGAEGNARATGGSGGGVGPYARGPDLAHEVLERL
jgi:hypothetical protein